MMSFLSSKYTIVIFDAIFSLGLEGYAAYSETDLNYSLHLTSSDFGSTNGLIIFSLSTLFLAFLSDNVTGKYYPALLGVVSLFVPCLYAFISYLNDKSSPTLSEVVKYCLLIYMPTNFIRDLVLLEHLKIPSEIDALRSYVFAIIYLRLLVRLLYNFLSRYFGGWQSFVLEGSLILISILYQNIFIVYGFILNVESLYPFIWLKVIKCFFSAAKNISIDYIGNEKFLNLANNVQPLSIRKKFFGYTQGTEDDTKTLDELEQPEEINEKDKYHWITSANSSVFVTYQTLRFYRIFPFVIFSILFSSFNFFVYSVSLNQENIVRKDSDNIRDNVSFKAYYLFFCAVLYVFFEFFVYPIRTYKGTRNLNFFFAGYVCLLISSLFVIVMQFRVGEAPFLPSRYFGQIRIFNGFDKEVTFTGFNPRREITLEPCGYEIVSDIFVDGAENQSVFIKKIDRPPIMENVEVIEKATRTFILFGSNFSQITDRDPTVFEKSPNHHLSKIVLLTAEPFYGKLKMVTAKKTITKRLTNVVQPTSLTPGNYDITISFKDKNFKTVLLKDLNFEKGALYGIFMCKNNVSYSGIRYHLEGPIYVSYIFLFPQLFFLCMGNAMSHVSFYRFLYKESPQKLRCTVFSLVVIGQSITSYVTSIFFKFTQTVLFFMLIGFTVLHTFVAIFGIYRASKFIHRFPY